MLAGASVLAVLRLLAVETGRQPLLLPVLGSTDASVFYTANEIVVATLFRVPRCRLYQRFSLLLCARLPRDPSRVRQQYTIQTLPIQKNNKYRLGRNFHHHGSSGEGGEGPAM